MMEENAMPPAVWRFITSPQPVSGAMNMAVDEAVFTRVDAGLSPPTLRLYAWQPPCLSLGTLQRSAEVDFEAAARCGYDVVRRPTGGRAILHTDELTYSVCGPLSDPRLSGNVLESYQRLAGALLQALQLLGLTVAVQQGGPTRADRSSPVCFEIPSHYELTIAGKKLLGSAQARRPQALLQHGSLPLTGDLTRITRALQFEDETTRRKVADRLLQRGATVEMITGRLISWEEAARAFAAGFEQALHLQLVPGELSPPEQSLAEQLCREKYTNSTWTLRV